MLRLYGVDDFALLSRPLAPHCSCASEASAPYVPPRKSFVERAADIAGYAFIAAGVAVFGALFLAACVVWCPVEFVRWALK